MNGEDHPYRMRSQRRHKVAGIGKLVGIGMVFMAGAYAQKCGSVTTKVSTAYHGAVSSISQEFHGGTPVAAEDFVNALKHDKHPVRYSNQILGAVVAGATALDNQDRAQAASALIGMTPDSIAYEVISQRMHALSGNYRLRMLADAAKDAIR